MEGSFHNARVEGAHMRSWTLVVVALAACGGGTEPSLDPHTSFGIEAADSLWMKCDAVNAQRDSAFHFVSRNSHLYLDPGQLARIAVWIEDTDMTQAAIPLRCKGTTGSGGGTERWADYSTTLDGGIAFEWLAVPVPDTAGFWITSEDVSLSSASRSGEKWTATLTIHGHTLPVLLDPFPY